MRTQAELLRDEAIARILQHNAKWACAIKTYFNEVWVPNQPENHEFIAEDFRLEALEAGFPKPLHPNAWGGVFSWIARSKLLEETGTIRKMKDPDSHARRSPVYRIIGRKRRRYYPPEL